MVILVFSVELLVNLVVHGIRLFIREPWNIFDAAVVTLSWVSYVGGNSLQVRLATPARDYDWTHVVVRPHAPRPLRAPVVRPHTRTAAFE